jgi:4a-hydroxytetrahydrobiopterin dehydratase
MAVGESHAGSPPRPQRRLGPMERSEAIQIDPGDLVRQACVPCTGETPRLTPDEAARLATGIDPAWRVGEGAIERTFGLRDFASALGLAVRIGLLAESQGHHPDLEVGWGRLQVRWTTHAIGGLSTNDFVMAAKVDRIVARGIGEKPESAA